MKRRVKYFCIGAVAGFLTLTALNQGLGTYERDVVVTGERNGIVTCHDYLGTESWAFRSNGGNFYIGERISLKMSDNGTFEDVTDDIVLGIRR